GAWADGGTNPATTVEAQLDKVIADLAATTGAPKVGAAATAGAPNALVAGSVKSQLDALLGFVNAHINLAAGAHAASAITYAGGGAWADATTNPATTVEAQLDKGPFLKAFAADIFFDDQRGHVESARKYVAAGHVPFGVANE
ncbi:MAG: 5'-nucleotidase, partial [Chloroflexi bacterium]|nr:5'-nucleotidase [Chloroflexota bacterium]